MNGYEKHSPEYGGPGKWRWGRVAVAAGWVAAFVAIIILQWGK